MRLRGSAVAAVILLSLLTTSCAGVTSSQVTWPPATAEQRNNFDLAMKYGDDAKEKYREALGNQSRLLRLLGAGLIPLAAAAGGIAATGGSTAAVVALLSATGGGMAEAAWLTSKPEQRAWAAGHNAITCAQSAVVSYRALYSVPGGQDPLKPLEDALRSALAEFDAALVPAQQALVAARGGGAGQASITATETIIANAQATRQSANDALATAERTRQEAARIPGELVDTVDNIGGQVAMTVSEQGPDVQSLARLVSGLAQGYGQFIQVPAKGAAPGQGLPGAESDTDDPKSKALATTARTLELRRLALDRATRALADRVNAVIATRPLDRLQACGVNTDKLMAPFTVEPAGPIHLTAGTPATVGFVIRGGAGPFAVNLEGAKLDGLTAPHRDLMSPAFVLMASDKTGVTVAAIHIADRAGHDQFIEVNVAATAPAKDANTSATDSGGISKWLGSAPAKLLTTPAQQRKFGASSAKITAASADQSNKILRVGVEISDNQGNRVSKVAADKVMTESNDQILDWIAETSGDKARKSSLDVKATNP